MKASTAAECRRSTRTRTTTRAVGKCRELPDSALGILDASHWQRQPLTSACLPLTSNLGETLLCRQITEPRSPVKMMLIVFPCKNCFRNCYSQEEFNRHQRSCQVENFCVECKSDFATSQQLRTHLTREHGHYSSCEFCDRHFFRRSQLEEHYGFSHSPCENCDEVCIH